MGKVEATGVPPEPSTEPSSVAEAAPPLPQAPEQVLAGGFPLPPISQMPPDAAWRANLDHYKTHLDFERLGIERFKALVDRDKMLVESQKLDFEQQKLSRQWNLDSAKATYDFARFAINAMLILNGGAALAIMQHLGAARDASTRFPLSALAEPLMFLCGGLAGAALSAGFSYLSQYLFTHEKQRIGLLFQVTGLLAWLASLGCFVWAVSLVARAMMGQ